MPQVPTFPSTVTPTSVRLRARRSKLRQPSCQRESSQAAGKFAVLLFAISGRESVRFDLGLQLGILRVELHRASNERGFALDPGRIWNAAFNRTYRLARLMVVESYAFGTEFWIDDVGAIS